jgi:transposase
MNGAGAPKETAVNDSKDIVLVVDYHLENLQIRQCNLATAEERCFKTKNTAREILRVVGEAQVEAALTKGKVVWIMESTTGWARVKKLLGEQAEFVLANVLQIPLPPKGKRRKTDRIDTQRMLREYRNGSLPRSFQPEAELRQVRRLVDCRGDLVHRQTALKNWISHYLSHETWERSSNLWSKKGRARLQSISLPGSDALVMKVKLQELEDVRDLLSQVEAEILAVYRRWPMAQWLDEVRGIAPLSAVTILAYIGPIQRFANAEGLIAYAGLAPGVHGSDGKVYHLRIGGGGTHTRLRYFLIEATRWLKEIPRYAGAYQRVVEKRGTKVARLVLARLFLRSLDKMLRSNVRFQPEAAAA